jgi:uncharacterized peroxidase-related enzyme
LAEQPHGQRLSSYRVGDGSPEADAALETVRTRFRGTVPNMHRVLATSPTAISAHTTAQHILMTGRGSLTRAEREIAATETARIYGCDYCVAAHRIQARNVKVAEEDIEALLDERPIRDPRLGAIQRLAGELIATRGRLSDDALRGYQHGGLSDADIVEVVSIVGFYTWSSFINNVAQTEIDSIFRTTTTQ